MFLFGTPRLAAPTPPTDDDNRLMLGGFFEGVGRRDVVGISGCDVLILKGRRGKEEELWGGRRSESY